MKARSLLNLPNLFGAAARSDCGSRCFSSVNWDCFSPALKFLFSPVEYCDGVEEAELTAEGVGDGFRLRVWGRKTSAREWC